MQPTLEKASKEYYGHIKEKNKLMPNVSAPIKGMTLQELLILEQQLHFNLPRTGWP